MEKKAEVCLDMSTLMNELKEALSMQEVKTDASDGGISLQAEKVAHLFSLKEFDLLLLYIKTFALKHKLVLPDVFNQEYYNDASKEFLCAAIVANCFETVSE